MSATDAERDPITYSAPVLPPGATFDPVVLAKYAGQFPALKLFTEGETFGDWSKVQKEFFGDGGLFDQIYKAPLAAQ